LGEQGETIGGIIQALEQILPGAHSPLLAVWMEPLMTEVARGEKMLFLVEQTQMLGPEQDTRIVGKIVMQDRDIQFRVVAHPPVVEISRANCGPEIIDYRDFGMDIDRAI